MKKQITILLLGLSMAMASQAHMLWLQRDGQQHTQAYFGEYAENLKETQSGPLKAFNQAKAIQQQQQYDAIPHENYLNFATTSVDQDVRVNQDLLHGDMLAQFRAKAGRQSTQAVTELEIVPMHANSDQFVLMFQAKPLAEQEIQLIAPDRSVQTLKSDAKGIFTIQTPLKGLYVIEVGKAIAESGTYNNQAYAKRYLLATLSFSVL